MEMLALSLLVVGSVVAGEVPTPVFETQFELNTNGMVIDNISPDLAFAGKVRGTNVSFVDTFLGKAAKFTGDPESRIEFPLTEKSKTPEKFTISIWFCTSAYPDANDAAKASRNYCFVSRGWEFYGITDSKGAINVNTQQLFPLDAPAIVKPGEWNHMAYTYSVPDKLYALYVNGQNMASKDKNWKQQAPMAIDSKCGLLLGSIAGYWPFNGLLARARIYDKALTAEQIAASEQDFVRKQLGAIKAELSAIEGSAAVIKKVDETLKLAPIPMNAAAHFYQEIKRLQSMVALKKSGLLTNEYLAYSIVDPMGPDVYANDSPLPAETMNGKLLMMAAQDEFEPASFIVKPLKDIAKFEPVIDDLKSKEGHILPASAIDIRVLKVMVACGSLNRKAGALRNLSPLVLLHDDALVKVDTEKMHNYIRLSLPGGVKYICVSEEDGSPKGYNLSAKEYPILDSKTFQPLNLKADFNQQFWLTLKTTKDTKPGLYVSNIRLTSAGKTIATIPIKVRVLPFALPDPKTNYDLERPFYASTYYFNSLVIDGYGTVGCGNRTIAQTRNCLLNLYDHGVRMPTTIMGFNFPGYQPWGDKKGVKPDPDLEQYEINRIQFLLMKEVGMWMKPLVFHTGGNFGYREYYVRSKDKEDLTRMVNATLDFCEKEVGHRDVWFYALDEAFGEKINAQYDVWQDMTDLGAKIYVTAQPLSTERLIGHKLTVVNMCHSPTLETAAAFHKDNCLVWKYANPFPVPGTRDRAFIHRLNYGLQLYFMNHDGVCPYSFNHYGPQLAWNLFGAGTGCIYVFPTADGCVDTPAWEAMREGLDDIRYATKLRQEIVKASQGDAGQKALAAEAAQFLDSQNPHNPEFQSGWVRWQIINRILDLVNQEG